MPWTYSTALTTARDQVRLLIGDTDEEDPQLDDAEVDYFLSLQGSVVGAAILAIRGLIARYARSVSRAAGDVREEAQQRIDNYTRLLRQLQLQTVLTTEPYAGGISVSDKAAQEENPDRVVPRFRRDLHREIGSTGGSLNADQREA